MTYKSKWLEPDPNILDEPLFYTANTVPKKITVAGDMIKTDFYGIDDIINALYKKEISIVTGLNGSGKSSWLSQLALNVTNNGQIVTLFSGELGSDRVLRWLQLQAAGKRNTVSTSNAYLFWVRDEIKVRINNWMSKKLFIYNNNYGEKVETVLEAIEKCVEKYHTDLVILDNLMALDLFCLSFDKYEQQKELILILDKFAEKMDVHIILVAHPRKSVDLLRKTDISGTADITNAADNVFIIHRVNEDFKRQSKLAFGWKTTNAMYEYDNIIEISKNRELGGMDMFAGLYYEKESKRFLNSIDEHKIYGWENDISIDQNEEIPNPFEM